MWGMRARTRPFSTCTFVYWGYCTRYSRVKKNAFIFTKKKVVVMEIMVAPFSLKIWWTNQKRIPRDFGVRPDWCKRDHDPRLSLGVRRVRLFPRYSIVNVTGKKTRLVWNYGLFVNIWTSHQVGHCWDGLVSLLFEKLLNQWMFVFLQRLSKLMSRLCVPVNSIVVWRSCKHVESMRLWSAFKVSIHGLHVDYNCRR